MRERNSLFALFARSASSLASSSAFSIFARSVTSCATPKNVLALSDKVDVFAPDQFGPGVAPELFACGVNCYKPTFLVDGTNYIQGIVHNDLIFGHSVLKLSRSLAQSFFGFFSLGNVLDHDEEMARVATFIADDTTGASSPDDLAVFAQITFLEPIVQSALQHRLGKFTTKGDIVGMSDVERRAVSEFVLG